MGRIYRAFVLKNKGIEVNVVALVDSGSDKCMLSKRIAKMLKLKTFAKEKIEVANGAKINTDIARVRMISQIDHIDDTMDVNITDKPFDNEIDENINMIIGVDFLQKHNVKLTFRKMKN